MCGPGEQGDISAAVSDQKEIKLFISEWLPLVAGLQRNLSLFLHSDLLGFASNSAKCGFKGLFKSTLCTKRLASGPRPRLSPEIALTLPL